MVAPTIESHNHSTSSGGTTTTIAVNASGAGRVIVVCTTLGTTNGSIIPTGSIASTDPNIGAWTAIGHMPITAVAGYCVLAWYARTTGVVSAATVTITIGGGPPIDDAATAYVTVAGGDVTQALDQNSTLATGASNGSSAKDSTGSLIMYASVNTNTANTLVFTVAGTNTGRTYANPTPGTTLTEQANNAGGSFFAELGVFTAPFTVQQTAAHVGSTDSYVDPLFAFAITADSVAAPNYVNFVGNIGSVSLYGKGLYGAALYSSGGPFSPVIAGDITLVGQQFFAGDLAPAITFNGSVGFDFSFTADLPPQVAFSADLTLVTVLSSDLAPQVTFNADLSLDVVLQASLTGRLDPIVGFAASSMISGPLWGGAEPCPPSLWTPVDPCDPVDWEDSELCHG